MHNGFLQDGQDYTELQMNDIFQNTSEKKKRITLILKVICQQNSSTEVKPHNYQTSSFVCDSVTVVKDKLFDTLKFALCSA